MSRSFWGISFFCGRPRLFLPAAAALPRDCPRLFARLSVAIYASVRGVSPRRVSTAILRGYPLRPPRSLFTDSRGASLGLSAAIAAAFRSYRPRVNSGATRGTSSWLAAAASGTSSVVLRGCPPQLPTAILRGWPRLSFAAARGFGPVFRTDDLLNLFRNAVIPDGVDFEGFE